MSAETQADQTSQTEESNFPFLQKDPNNPALLHCSHDEAKGTFLMQKSNFRREREKERIKGVEAGPSPTPDGIIMAEWYATIALGFEKVPDGFDVDEVEDETLIEALYEEVRAYWASFRPSK